MNKLEGLPTIHYISLEESVDRRSNLENWFSQYNIDNYVPHLFKRFEEYNHQLTGPYVDLLAPHSKGPITSHFTFLKEWYESSSEDYIMVVEDDLSLEPVKYWNFTWKEFENNLPNDWQCVQLVVVREYDCEDFYFEKRRDRDWCAAAFLIKREYAKILLDRYYSDDVFDLNIENSTDPPVIERLLFTNSTGVYSFPLFVEDCYATKTTLLPEAAHEPLVNGQGYFHHSSHDYVINWWKNKGCKLTPQDILSNMPFNYINLKSKYNLNIKGIIHVGAHYGEEVQDYINSGVTDIVLFEPLQDNFSILCDRMENVKANITLNKVALGSSLSKTTMYVSDNEKQSSSILKPKVHLLHHPNVYFPDMEEVDVELLDNFNCSHCNYLHIDVQGYELEVLKGATETLKHIDYVYCEVNRDELYEGNPLVEEIDEFLLQYNIKRVETDWMGDLWGDALYIRN